MIFRARKQLLAVSGTSLESSTSAKEKERLARTFFVSLTLLSSSSFEFFFVLVCLKFYSLQFQNQSLTKTLGTSTSS